MTYYVFSGTLNPTHFTSLPSEMTHCHIKVVGYCVGFVLLCYSVIGANQNRLIQAGCLFCLRINSDEALKMMQSIDYKQLDSYSVAL